MHSDTINSYTNVNDTNENFTHPFSKWNVNWMKTGDWKENVKREKSEDENDGGNYKNGQSNPTPKDEKESDLKQAITESRVGTGIGRVIYCIIDWRKMNLISQKRIVTWEVFNPRKFRKFEKEKEKE
jgi:hypothetical protein